MFDKLSKLKDLAKMRSQAMAMQKALAQIKKRYEKGRFKVVVTGDQKVEYVEIDGQSQEDLVRAINEALKEVQKDSAKKMLEMGGGLSGLLGNL